jgi:hypothetical protein
MQFSCPHWSSYLCVRILLMTAIMSQLSLESSSYSIFVKPGITTNPIYELALSNYEQRHYLTHSENRYAFSLKPFYQQSTHTCQLGSYFTPGNLPVMKWRENGSGDIDPLWLEGISAVGTAYSSEVRLRPRIQQGGLVFNFYATLPYCLWLSINTAYMNVTSHIHVEETNNMNQGQLACLQTAQGMLTNCQWLYNTFPEGKQSRSGVDDIQIKLGWDIWQDQAVGHLAGYLVGTIPTGNKPRTYAILEPLVGTRNGSVGLGMNADWFTSWCADRTFSLMFDLKYRYVFAHWTKRSFDLCANGDWSRYLLVATPEDPATPLPGINYMTRCAKVTPGSTINLWAAGHYEHGRWQMESGYGFWWRQQEKITCGSICQNVPAVGIFDLAGSVVQNPVSASSANISQTVPATGYTNIMRSDTVFTPIAPNALNLASGAHPDTYSNTLYGSVGYQFDRGLIGINVLYEWGKRITALTNWGMWLTTSVEF